MHVQEVMYYICEFAERGDLYSALADDNLAEELSWYNRQGALFCMSCRTQGIECMLGRQGGCLAK